MFVFVRFFPFLKDAFTHLSERVCLSLCPSVHSSVHLYIKCATKSILQKNLWKILFNKFTDDEFKEMFKRYSFPYSIRFHSFTHLPNFRYYQSLVVKEKITFGWVILMQKKSVLFLNRWPPFSFFFFFFAIFDWCTESIVGDLINNWKWRFSGVLFRCFWLWRIDTRYLIRLLLYIYRWSTSLESQKAIDY